jgi:crotonobetainyl-CoA:carnitine CoA-transferase CaiB-like acyl-CoA transferase
LHGVSAFIAKQNRHDNLGPRKPLTATLIDAMDYIQRRDQSASIGGSRTVLLDGIRIVSFCHYLQGPAATQYLADMGAEVIKIEPPTGAHERKWSGARTFVGDISGFYLCANRNKRSLAVDLKAPQGRDLVLKLIDTADAVVENFRPGVLDRLGFGYEALKARKPDLIYASASGFGGTGPLARKPGQDLLVQARCGLAAVTGNQDTGPTPVGCAAVDQHGGALLALGVVGACVRKMRTGEGTRVEASLFGAGVDLQTEALTNYLSGLHGAERLQRDRHLATWFHEAPYGVYRCRDGWLALSLNDPKKLAEALGDAALIDLAGIDLYDERDRYARAAAEAVAGYTLDEIATRLDPEGLWWAPVQDYDQLFRDPQARHNEMFREIDVKGARAVLVNHPNRYDGAVPALRHLALEVGQDTADLMRELGFDDDAIAELDSSGVVRAHTGSD